MQEVSQYDCYLNFINMGASEAEAIDGVIDLFTGGLACAWESDKWERAREIVRENIREAELLVDF